MSDNESEPSQSDTSNESGFEQPDEVLRLDQQSVSNAPPRRPSIKIQVELPLANQISDKHYSLEPDMIFGYECIEILSWMPKLRFNGPITLTFKSHVNDQISELEDEQYRLLYLGFRPPDSIRLHKQFASPSSYPFRFESLLENPKLAHLMPLVLQQRKSTDRPFVGMNPKYSSSVVFDSVFEGGNLDLAVQVSEHEFDLFMRVDSNTRGHLSWYNFRVSGLRPKVAVKLNICNFTKSKCLYTKGMRPFIQLNNGPWAPGGANVNYKEQRLRYQVEYSRRYFTLSFEIESKSAHDRFQIAYCVPYDYSKILGIISEMCQRPWCKQTKLCQDLSGIDIPLLTVTDQDESIVPMSERKMAIIQARIHPGESNGSWMMHGFLQFLESPASAQLKRRYHNYPVNSRCILKIIPMVNPDGVVLGNYRTGMAGRDLNREFIEADQVLYPAVRAVKTLVAELAAKHRSNLIAFIDMHGHSVKKNVFIYGPEFSIWDPNYLQCRILPKLLDNKTSMFRYYSSIFRISQHKKSTARGVFCDLHDIVNCFTVEASNGFHYNQEKQRTFEFKPEDWVRMGFLIGEAMTEMVEHLIAMQQMMLERATQRKESGHSKTRSKRYKNKSSSQLLTKQQLDSPAFAEFETRFKDTAVFKFMDEIKRSEQTKPYLPKADSDDSEGRSDSESSQDDDDQLVQELRKQIVRQTQQEPVSRKQRRKSKSKKKHPQQNSQKLVKPPLPSSLLEQRKQSVVKPVSRMAFGLSLGKQPLPSIPSTRSDNRRRPSSKPAFQIITKNLHTGSTVNTIQQDFYSYQTNLTQSFVPTSSHDGTPIGHNRPVTAIIDDPHFNSRFNSTTITHRENNRFKSEQLLHPQGRTSPVRNAILLNRAINQFEDEKNSILEQQGFIRYMLSKHESQYQAADTTINNNTANNYFSTKSVNICPQLQSLSPEKLLVQPTSNHQFENQLRQADEERLKPGREKQFKVGKQNFPSAFYSMKKHLFNKKKPQIDEYNAPMVVKLAPTSRTKR